MYKRSLSDFDYNVKKKETKKIEATKRIQMFKKFYSKYATTQMYFPDKKKYEYIRVIVKHKLYYKQIIGQIIKPYILRSLK